MANENDLKGIIAFLASEASAYITVIRWVDVLLFNCSGTDIQGSIWQHCFDSVAGVRSLVIIDD